MNAEKMDFHLSDNEHVVRNYECTNRTRLFGSPVVGYLTITNKRVVYHSQVKSINGSSAVVSELPLDDVSGISTSVSVSFNWIFFIIFCLIMYFATFLVSSILPPFLTGWVISILLLLPYLIALLFEKNILSQEIRQQFLQNINEIPGSDFLRKKDRTYYVGIFRFVFLIGLALVAWNIVRNSRMIQFSLMTFILLGVAYFLIYRAIFGKVRNFNLAIASRSPKNAGIIIPGNPLSLLLGGDTAALQSIYSGPGQDAEQIVSELGAILTDIRQLGDLGIQKWMGRQ